MEQEPKSGEQIFEELRQIRERAMDGDRMFETNDKIVAFVEQLKSENPDLSDYLLFHLLVGSSPREGAELKFDLPDHALENFIRSLEK